MMSMKWTSGTIFFHLRKVFENFGSFDGDLNFLEIVVYFRHV